MDSKTRRPGTERVEFAARAAQWLRDRPGRTLTWPADRRDLILAVGVPCDDCLQVVRHPRDANHTVRYATDGERRAHWSDAITATCGQATPAAVEDEAPAPVVISPIHRIASTPPPAAPASAVPGVTFSAGA